jgi:hypothetical protein
MTADDLASSSSNLKVRNATLFHLVVVPSFSPANYIYISKLITILVKCV